MKTFLVYLSIKPEMAKRSNLPLRLPLLLEDFVELGPASEVRPEMVLRGLRAQIKAGTAEGATSEEGTLDYYASYFLFFLYENVKSALSEKAFDKAGALLEEARAFLDRFPHLVKAHDARLDFYQALYAFRTGFPGQAETVLRKIVTENPKNPYFAMELARLLEEQDDVDSALEVYAKVVEEDPAFLPALFSMGEIFLRTGDYDRAEDSYKACIQTGADFVPPYARLGVIYNNRQQYTKAVHILTQGLSRAPEDAPMHYNLSFALQKTSKPFSALAHLKAALVQNPDSIPVLNEIGVLYRKLGLFEESLDALKKARSADEENLGILWNLLWTTMLISKEEFDHLLTRSLPFLTRYGYDVERFSPFHSRRTSRPFDLFTFLAELAGAYEGIPGYLEERLHGLLVGRIPTEEMDSSEDLIVLDWIVDLFENYDADPIELFRGILLVNVALTRSTRWMAFCFSLLELVAHLGGSPFDLEKVVETLALTAQEYDWNLARQILGIDQDQFFDWTDLVETSSSISSLYELIRWIINLMWIDPTVEELETLPVEPAFKRLIGYVFRKTQEAPTGT